MNSPAFTSTSVSPVRPPSRTGIRLLYAVCLVLALLSVGFIVAIILVCRQLYLNNALTG